jgi:hypothetical protein
MRLLHFAFCAVLFSALSLTPAFAQRGGSRGGGGGGFRGGGGAARSGGGFSGGVRGGNGFSGGVRGGGGFSGGFRGSGGFAGRGFAGSRGFGGGFRGGFRSGFRGFGGGFLSWGFPYYGWGFPYAYGYPYVSGYPYAYGYCDPYYYDCGYGPYDYGYAYAPPAPGPTVVNQYGNQYAPQAYSYPAQNVPPQRVRNYGPSEPLAPRNVGSQPFYRTPDFYLIAFTDHTIQAAVSFLVEGDTIRYTTREHVEKTAPLSSVDLRFSRQINRDRHVDFQLPQPESSRL